MIGEVRGCNHVQFPPCGHCRECGRADEKEQRREMIVTGIPVVLEVVRELVEVDVR